MGALAEDLMLDWGPGKSGGRGAGLVGLLQDRMTSVRWCRAMALRS